MVDGMTSTGSTLISETEALSEVLNTTIAGSVNSMMTNGSELMSQMDTLSKGLESYLSGLEAQITNQATQMEPRWQHRFRHGQTEQQHS